MSAFYKMLVSTDPKIIGTKDGWGLYADESADFASIPRFSSTNPDIILSNFFSHKGSKSIDFFNIANSENTSGIIVSEKVKNIIEEHNTLSVQFIRCIIHKQEKVLSNYFLLHCYSYLMDKIDYKNVPFQRVWPYPKEVEENYGIIDEKTLMRECKKYAGQVVYIEPIGGFKFVSFNYLEYDMFRIGYIDDFIYVSDKLKKSLSDCIGAEFFQVPQNHFR